MQLGRFAGSVGQHVRERSGGLQSNSKAAKTGVGELDAIVRGQENRSPPPQTLGLAGWPCAAAAIRKLGVATPNYCDLRLPKFHALQLGALAVQTRCYIFKHSREAR